MERENWLNELDALIQERHMLNHPFYRAWSEGLLPKETLQQYAKEYYYHVKAFLKYLSTLHSRCEDPQVSRNLLENLVDEEMGKPNHPELWRQFAHSLGVSDEELDAPPCNSATKKLVECFMESCRNGSVAEGVTALYCYESQIPAICPTKIEGLRRHYGVTDPAGYAYFSVHATADVEHARVERKIIDSLISEEATPGAIERAKKTLDALWDFLSAFPIPHCATQGA